MPTNLELKARIKSPAQIVRRAKKICLPGGVFSQIDTYFQVKRGRLKLREFSGKRGELIYYERNEVRGERWSKYLISPVKDPSTMKNLLGIALGVRIVVRKSRRLFLYKGARIHIDSVFRLGHFVEIEVIVRKGRHQARSLLREITTLFEIEEKTSIACSYAELMEKESLRNQQRSSKSCRKRLARA